MPCGLFYPYKLDEYICSFRGVCFSFYYNQFYRTCCIYKANSVDPGQTQHNAVCLCSFSETLGMNGFILSNLHMLEEIYSKQLCDFSPENMV